MTEPERTPEPEPEATLSAEEACLAWEARAIALEDHVRRALDALRTNELAECGKWLAWALGEQYEQ